MILDEIMMPCSSCVMINLIDDSVGLAPRKRLTKEEWKLLQNSERVIQSALRTFLRIGKSLATVRRKKLYRQSHRTFELYCKARWDFSARHARNLIRAWETSEVLSRSSLPIPAHESHFRALGKLPMSLREDAWTRSMSFAGGPKNVTAKHVGAVVKIVRPRRKLSAYDKDRPTLS
jgi:hypothetical protein